MRSDAPGWVRMQLDASGKIWKISEKSVEQFSVLRFASQLGNQNENYLDVAGLVLIGFCKTIFFSQPFVLVIDGRMDGRTDEWTDGPGGGLRPAGPPPLRLWAHS